jgi:hypothetical protein
LRNTFVFILQLGSKEVLPLGSAQYSKKIAEGPLKMALSKKQEKFVWISFFSQGRRSSIDMQPLVM